MKKKKSNRSAIIITILISAFMILSVFEVVLFYNPGTDQLKYGKYSFNTVQSGYQVKANGKYYVFDYFPSDVEQINLSPSISSQLKNAQALIFSFNPEESADNLQYVDTLRYELSQQSPIPIIAAVTNISLNYSGLPVLTCTNATNLVPVILLNISADTSISQNDNCIIMNAKLKQIVAAKDRIVYSMLGIMN